MPFAMNLILLKRWLDVIRRKNASTTVGELDKKPEMRSELMEISEVIENELYLSGYRAITGERLSSSGITAIVKVITEEEEKVIDHEIIVPDHVTQMIIRLPDMESTDMQMHFDTVSQFIDNEIRNGGKVLVHCGAGISRSATLIIAYLIKYKQYTLRGAYELTRSKRKLIRPNNGFFRQLIEFERSSREDGRSTVRMIMAPSGQSIPDIVFEQAVMAKLR